MNVPFPQYYVDGVRISIAVPLPPDAIALCDEFANNSVDSSASHYSQRGQTNKAAIIAQISVGKKVELAAYRLLKLHDTITKPDFKIYRSRNKNWDSDMKFTASSIPIHCKGATLKARQFGLSWVVQWGGNGYGHRDTELLDSKIGYIALGSPNEVDPLSIDIFGFLPLSAVEEHALLQEPEIDRLKGKKKVIHFDTTGKHSIRDAERAQGKDLRWSLDILAPKTNSSP